MIQIKKKNKNTADGTSVREDAESQEFPCTAGGSAKWHRRSGKHSGSSWKS